MGFDFRDRLRKRDGYGTRAFRPSTNEHCRVCGQKLDGYHDTAKCQKDWLSKLPNQRQGKDVKP